MNHGFVKLVDSMPRENLDASIVQAARVSYSGGTSVTRSDKGLIRYLMRHWHNTPFEMVEFKFHIKMPIFLARQHMRHRTASVNELSARYSEIPEDFFTPEHFRLQSKVNKQSSEGVSVCETESTKEYCHQGFEMYTKLLEQGCCRELARCHLPQSTYTEFYWKINLHNLMHYLRLRMEPGAQLEIQEYAKEIYKIVQPLCPLTMEAFMDFRVNSLTLSGPELAAMKNGTKLESPTEQREFEQKLLVLHNNSNVLF